MVSYTTAENSNNKIKQKFGIRWSGYNFLLSDYKSREMNQQLLLTNILHQQIKVWFQNRRMKAKKAEPLSLNSNNVEMTSSSLSFEQASSPNSLKDDVVPGLECAFAAAAAGALPPQHNLHNPHHHQHHHHNSLIQNHHNHLQLASSSPEMRQF